MPEEYEPPVVAVVIASEADAWLEACLQSLEQQDYPSLDVLVIDSGDGAGVTNRVAAIAPAAFVRRLPGADSFAAAADDVLVGIDGASFFLFCHGVALAPSAVRMMVEEAFRANAGLVGPKLVDWDAPDRLVEVGRGVSRTGEAVPRVQPGELDQSQHDEAREVFAVPSACMLARVDLFAALGGFDREMGSCGEDVDLCWRAQLAGARVVTAPRALVRCRDGGPPSSGQTTEELTVARSHALRAVLKNYGLIRRWFIGLQLLLLTLLDSVAAPLTGTRGRARAARGAWRWNVRHRRSLREMRRALREVRQVSDRTIAGRMTHRSRLHLRAPAASSAASGVATAATAGSPDLAAPATSADERSADTDHVTDWLLRARRGEVSASQVIAAVVLGLLALVGVRGLLFGSLPVLGQLPGPIPSAFHLLGEWITGRPDAGWRPTQAGPPAYGVIGLVGTILGDRSGLALRLVFLSGLAVGTVGTFRLAKPFGSSRGRLVAAIAFAASPLVWNGLARGDLELCVALAGLPFVFGRLARASGLAPFAPSGPGARERWDGRQLLAEIAPLGLLLAVICALSPPVILAVGVLAVGSLAACVAVGGLGGVLRSAAVAAGGALIAFLCCMPWSVTWLESGSRWSLLAGDVPPPGSGLRPADLLRGHIGPVGGWWGAFGLVAFAAFAFVWARGPRLAWTTRWWLCALFSVAIAWLGNEGWLGAGGGSAVLLAPATVAIAGCCGIGVAAFELDLRRLRFGWRQVTGVVAAACFVAGVLPALGTLFGGRGDLPGVGFEETASEFTTPSPPGARVLWIGSPLALPGSAFQAGPGTAALVTTGGLPSASDVWPTADPGPAADVTADVAAAVRGRTLSLGGLLARYGVRFIVVPAALAPTVLGEQAPAAAPPPPRLVRALETQTDLRQMPPEDGLLVWANAAWTPADGTGRVEAPGASSSPSLRALGVAGALVVLVACLLEGLVRRRRLPSRRISRDVPLGGPGPLGPQMAERAPSPLEEELEPVGVRLTDAPMATAGAAASGLESGQP